MPLVDWKIAETINVRAKGEDKRLGREKVNIAKTNRTEKGNKILHASFLYLHPTLVNTTGGTLHKCTVVSVTAAV